ARDTPAPSRSLTIAGNPAIERKATITLPGPAFAGGKGSQPRPFLALTTAIAVGGTVVRFETQLSADADAATIDRVFQVARNFVPEAMPDLHAPAPAVVPITHNTPGPPPPVAGITAPSMLAPGTFGELEIA